MSYSDWIFFNTPVCEGAKKCGRESIYLVTSEDDFGGAYIPLCMFHFIRRGYKERNIHAMKTGTITSPPKLPTAPADPS